MEFPALKQAQGELEHARKELRAVFTEAGPDYDMSQVKTIHGDAKDKVDWIRAQNDKIEKLAEKVKNLRDVSEIAGREGGQREIGDGALPGVKSVGASFLKSLKAKGRGGVHHVDIETKDVFERTDGWSPESTRSGRLELQPLAPAVQVTDFLPTTTINQAAYKYMREDAFSNVAAETGEGNIFPEADLSLSEASVNVEKIAVWIPATDEQLEDEPAARAYIDMRLQWMLQQRLDYQILNGNGSAPNLLGTLNVGSINDVVNANTNQPIIDSLGELFLEIQTVGFAEPNVAFVTPTEMDLIRKAKTADGQYLWAHPSQSGPTTVWGVPLKPLLGTMLPAGTRAVAGDYAHYSLLGIKRGIDMQVTNTHSTFFVEGKQAIRADMRAVVVHFRPSAFGTVTTS
jgi:hypothetical protein